MLIDECYCSLTDALVKNWDSCGLGEYFDKANIVDHEDNENPDGPYAVIEELTSSTTPFDQNCDTITDTVPHIFTAHCIQEKEQANELGKLLRAVLNGKFKSINTECGTIGKIEAGRPNVRRIGYQFLMRLQFNVTFTTGRTG